MDPVSWHCDALHVPVYHWDLRFDTLCARCESCAMLFQDQLHALELFIENHVNACCWFWTCLNSAFTRNLGDIVDCCGTISGCLLVRGGWQRTTGASTMVRSTSCWATYLSSPSWLRLCKVKFLLLYWKILPYAYTSYTLHYLHWYSRVPVHLCLVARFSAFWNISNLLESI